MKNQIVPYLVASLFVLGFLNSSYGQLTGTKTVPGDYASIAAAITDLNASGVGVGGVTFNIAADYTETIPSGGYAINIIANQPTFANPLMFQKSGSGANPLIQSSLSGSGILGSATLGSNGDAFIKFVGTDFVTIDGIDILENYTGGTQSLKMEYGILMVRASATDGCKNVTIKNCVITQQQTDVSSVGIASLNVNAAGTLTNPSAIFGRHENIFIDGCTIQNAETGMYFLGYNDVSSPYNLYENNYQIGVTNANIFRNIGEGVANVSTSNAIYGVYMRYLDSVRVHNNTIRVNTGSAAATAHHGIYLDVGINSNVDLNNNTVSDTCAYITAGTSAQQSGIYNLMGGTGTNNTVSITNNTVQYCYYPNATSPTVHYLTQEANAYTVNISGNTVGNNTIGGGASGTATGTQYGIRNSPSLSVTLAGSSCTISNNAVSNITRTQSTLGSGILYGIFVGNASLTTNINNNAVSNLSNGANSGNLGGIWCQASVSGGTLNIYNNTVNDITKTTGVTIAPVYGIYANQSTPTTNCYGNTIYNISNASTATTGTVYGYYNAGVGTTAENFYNNTLYNVTNSNGTGITIGANITSGGSLTKQIYGNSIYNLTGNGVTGGMLINNISTANIYKNRVHNITSNQATAATVAYGIQLGSGGTSPTHNIYNNMIHEIKAPSGSSVNSIYALYLNGGSTSNVFYNTVYLDASSSNITFGTAALFAVTTTTLDLRNNVLINKSTPGSSSGFTVAYRRGNSVLTSYSANSDRNNFYSGTPASNILIFYDGTNSDQTLTDYKTRVNPRDVNSISENTVFANTTTSPYDLHINLCQQSSCESGASIISSPISVTTDFDGNNRYNNFPYPACSTFTPTAPDIGADEYGGTGADNVAPTIIYTPLSNTASTSNRSFPGVAITDASGINTASGLRPRCYYKKSTDANVWNDNTCATDGWKWVEANGTVSPFDFTIDYSKLNSCSGVSSGNTVQYFVIAQDLASMPNVGINSGSFASQPSSVDLTSSAFPIGGAINNYTITSSFSGVYYIGSGQPYTSLTGSSQGFFAAINAGVVAGNITAFVTSDISEDGSNMLNQWLEQGLGNYRIRIVPVDAVEKVISGNVAGAMITFNGCDRVTIDGNNGLLALSGTKYFRFRNTSTSPSAITINFQNDASYDSVKNSIIEGAGSNTNFPPTAATIYFGTTTGSNGNDYNVITECDIRDLTGTAGTPYYAIGGVGTSTSASQYNSFNVISINNIYNFWGDGVLCGGLVIAGGVTDWTVSGNSFYQTATRTMTTSVQQGWNILMINSSLSNNNVVTGNYIGGSQPSCGGTPWTVNGVGQTQFGAVRMFVGNSTATSIQGNTIANIDITETPVVSGGVPFVGILNNGGTVNCGNITGNTIGSASGNDNIKVTTLGSSAFTFNVRGIDYRTGTSGNIQNNSLGSITVAGSSTGQLGVEGIIYTGTPSSAVTISNNNIGSGTTAASIRNTSASYACIINGINSSISSVTLTLSNNTVRNMTDLSANVSSQIRGIIHTGSSVSSIISNIVSELATSSRQTSATPPDQTAAGIVLNSDGSGHLISQNSIQGIRSTTTGIFSTSVFGIAINQESSAPLTTVSRNRIFDLTSTAVGSSPIIWGIFNYFGTWVVTNNQVTLTNGEITDNSGSNVHSRRNGDLISPNMHHNPISSIVASRETTNLTSGNTYNNSVILGNGQMSTSAFTDIGSEEIVRRKTFSKEDVNPNEGDLFTNAVNIEGIVDNAGGAAEFYYNSVYIGGSPSSGAGVSRCYRRMGLTNVTMRNNLFFNARLNTGTASGTHYSVSDNSGLPSVSWNSNYNALLSRDTNSIGEISSVSKNITSWRASTIGDLQSWSTSSSSINSVNLFQSISTGNLNILGSTGSPNPEAWIVSGKGIAVAGQNLDYEGNSRVISVLGGCTDIGADEFSMNPSSNPYNAVQIGSPGSGAATYYRLWGRILCRIDWSTMGTSYPSTMNVKYYSGINPSNTLGGNYGNSYWNVSVGSGTFIGKYSITMSFGDNETYTIGSPSVNTILAKLEASNTWEVFPLYISGPTNWKSQLDWSNKTIKVDSLQTFSDFALTDASSPLPVQISSFNASVTKNNVKLHWVTEQEINNKGFYVERREELAADEYSEWVGVSPLIGGHGTSNEPEIYDFVNNGLKVGKYQYRLRQEDYNGNSEYYELRNPTDVVIGKPINFEISQNYPNPSNPKSKIDYQIPFDGKVSIKIYDLIGREVLSLVNEVQEAGYYTAEFDGSNFASGIYIYRIIAEGSGQKFVKSLKLVVVK